MSNLKMVSVNGKSYLGKVTEGEGKTVITDALEIGSGSVSEGDLVEYLSQREEKKLREVKVSGMGATFSQEDLDADMVMSLEILDIRMVQARKIAVPALVTETFRRNAGK